MPDLTVEPREHYVYALFREDGVTPFYIGMGKGDRWLQHECNAHRRKNHKNNIILYFKAARCPVPKVKLCQHLTKDEAISLEIEFIAYFGRRPNGPLVNATSGGEGILDLTPEILAARTKAIASAQRRPEVNAKRSASLIGRKMPPRTDAMREAARIKSLRNHNWGKMSPEQQAEARACLDANRAKTHETTRRNYANSTPEDFARRRRHMLKAWVTRRKNMKSAAQLDLPF